MTHTAQTDLMPAAEMAHRAAARRSRDVDFPALLGEAFARLPAAVRARFGRHVCTAARPLVYRGTMLKMYASPLGRLLALAARLVGNPVVASNESGVACTVTLTPDTRQGGTVWHRAYHLAKGTRCATTTKRTRHTGAPVEQFNRWAGMELDITEQAGQLHFTATRYFAQWRGRLIHLPAALSPGRLTIVHRDVGAGRFRFILTLTHPLFGVLIHQDGEFSDPEDMS